VKKRIEVSGPDSTASFVDGHQDAKDRPIQEIARNGPSTPSLDVPECKEVLLPLLAERITQLPLESKKMLAMYYHEGLPVSGIAACFNLPPRRIDEILTQTVGLLGNHLLNLSKNAHPRNG
jgi:hypothetical protein